MTTAFPSQESPRSEVRRYPYPKASNGVYAVSTRANRIDNNQLYSEEQLLKSFHDFSSLHEKLEEGSWLTYFELHGIGEFSEKLQQYVVNNIVLSPKHRSLAISNYQNFLMEMGVESVDEILELANLSSDKQFPETLFSFQKQIGQVFDLPQVSSSMFKETAAQLWGTESVFYKRYGTKPNSLQVEQVIQILENVKEHTANVLEHANVAATDEAIFQFLDFYDIGGKAGKFTGFCMELLEDEPSSVRECFFNFLRQGWTPQFITTLYLLSGGFALTSGHVNELFRMWQTLPRHWFYKIIVSARGAEQ